jgi:hypothetical protein
MDHDFLLALEDGSVRNFRIYGRSKPRVGEVVTLPVNGKLIKIHIDEINGSEIIGSLDRAEAVETEIA